MPSSDTERPADVTTTSSRPDAGPASGVSYGRLTVGLCIGITAIAFEAMAVSTAMPRAAEDLGAKSWYAWAFSIFQASMLFATIASGRLSDRIGPVKPMIAGMALFGIGLVIAGTALSMPQLVIGRGVQGLGGGTISVALYVIIARFYPASSRPKVMSWMSTAWVVPGLVGPLISGWLTETFSWHWVFGAVIPVLLVAAALMIPLLLTLERRGAVAQPEADPHAARSPIWAAGLAAASVPILQLAAQQPGWWSIPMVVLAVALLAVALPRLMPPGVWRLQRGIGPVIVVRALIGGVFFTTEAFTVLMLVDLYGLDVRLAGLVLTLSALGWATGSFLQARWKLRRDQLMTVGTAGILVGIVGLIGVIAGHTPFYWLVGAAWIIAGLGMGLAFASTTIAVMALSPAAEQGRNASALQLAEALGASVVIGLTGALYAQLLRSIPTELSTVFALLMVGTAALALVAVLVSRRIGPVAH